MVHNLSLLCKLEENKWSKCNNNSNINKIAKSCLYEHVFQLFSDVLSYSKSLGACFITALNADVSWDFLERLISAGIDLGGGAVMCQPIDPVQNPVGGQEWSFWKLQGFSTPKSLLIKIIPSTTCDKTNPTYFFSKILPKFELEVTFLVYSCSRL